jgi:capsular polysaccharide biosynthesis protein
MQTPLFLRIIAAVRHQWLIVLVIIALGVLAAAAAALSSHPKYTATTSVLMVAGSAEAPNSQELATSTKPLLSTDLPSLATGATVLNRLRADIGEAATPLESVRSRVRAKVNSDSTIMQVEYTGKTSDKAIRGANLLGNEITAFYRELATTRFDSLISDFKAQLTSRRSELARLDGEIADISKTYPYIDVKSPGSSDYGTQSVYQRLISLRTERDELQASLQADLAGAAATHQLIANAKPEAMRDVIQSDTTYARVKEQYSKDLAEFNRLSAFGSQRYPGLIELRRTVSEEAKTVEAARRRAASIGPASNNGYLAALDAQTRADGQVSSDRAKVDAESRALSMLELQIGRRSIATDVARIRRDHDNSEAAYSIIASRLAKSIADRAEAASTGSVVVLERARFASKSSLGGGSIAAVALLFLSVWLALTIALMVDSSQEWFHNSRTIETVYGAPVIGSLA